MTAYISLTSIRAFCQAIKSSNFSTLLMLTPPQKLMFINSTFYPEKVINIQAAKYFTPNKLPAFS
jgi:hypothetical protein